MTIQEILDNILHAVFGRDVRQSMHDGVKRANDICDEVKARQTELEKKYTDLLNNFTSTSPSNAEIVDARNGTDGNTYATLKERLDTENTAKNTAIDKLKNADESLEESMKLLKESVIDELDIVMENNKSGKIAGASALKELTDLLYDQVADFGDFIVESLSVPVMATKSGSSAKYNRVTGEVYVRAAFTTITAISAGTEILLGYIPNILRPNNMVAISACMGSANTPEVTNAVLRSKTDSKYPGGITVKAVKDIPAATSYAIYVTANYFIAPGAA